MTTVSLLPDSGRLHGVAVRSATATGKAPISFLRIWRNLFWVRHGDNYVNLRSLQKRVALTPKSLERQVHLAQVVADRVLIKSAAQKLGISQSEYVVMRDHYARLDTLTDAQVRKFSKRMQVLIKIAKSMKECHSAIPFADFVEICIEAKRMEKSTTTHYKGRDHGVVVSLMKDDRGRVYATFSIKTQASANIGRGAYKQVNKAVRMSDGTIVARARQKLRAGLTQDMVDGEEKRTRRFAGDSRIFQIDGVVSPLRKPGRRYWFSPLYRGDLQARMGTLSPNDKIRMAAEMTRGVAKIHKRGIVHRDIKPANVLIDRKGHAVVADFGLSEEGISTEQRGSPYYMSPEVLSGGTVADASKVDVWALGVTFYELFSTGNVRPFWRKTDDRATLIRWLNDPGFDACMQSHMEADLPGPKNARLRAMLTGMLTQDPARRWTLAQVQRAIAAL